MPYSNVDESLWAAMDSCVEKVMAGDASLSKESAIAICHESVAKAEETAVAKASAAILRQAGGDHWKLASKANSTKFTVVKQADGSYRWVMSTSNAFEDRDGEILSEKALAADVARADALGTYGPLRWWHVDESHLGDCDFNAMHGKMLVESGTFKDARIAEAVAAHADGLSGSLGFFHPVRDPDQERVYNSIERFERSLLPKDKASNPWITLLVSKEEQGMDEKKIEKLGELIGDPEAVKDYLTDVSDIEKRALDAGVRHKEEMPAETKQEEDLEARPARVRDAVCKLYPGYGNAMSYAMWAQVIFEDHVIIAVDSKTYSAPYTDDGETATIGDFSTWTEVKQEWVPAAAAPAPEAAPAPVGPEAAMAEASKAEWDVAYQNDLPDDSFLFVESGGEKDETGKTVPRSLRHFPYKNSGGEIDLPHLRNAIARIPQSNAPGLNKEEVQAHAQNLLAEATGEEKQDEAPPEQAPQPDENTKIGEMTLGELTKLMSAVVSDMMGSASKETKGTIEVVAASVAEVSKAVTALKAQVAEISDETPRALKRGERVSEQDKSKIDNLPIEKQEELKASVPTFDSHFTDKFLAGIKSASGAGVETLVLGGGPKAS